MRKSQTEKTGELQPVFLFVYLAVCCGFSGVSLYPLLNTFALSFSDTRASRMNSTLSVLKITPNCFKTPTSIKASGMLSGSGSSILCRSLGSLSCFPLGLPMCALRCAGGNL